MRWLLVVLAFGLAVPASGQGAGDLPSPFQLLRPQDGDGPLAGLLRLREAEARYADTDLWPVYAQARATAESFAGEHGAALVYWDAAYPGGRNSVGALPPGTRAVDAADYIAEAAENVRVVMVNEAHHDASTRLLTLRLLPLLYERGYRYLAAETLEPLDPALNDRGYPVDTTGYYVRETVFAALVREALRLGYTLVRYEVEEADEVEGDTLSRQQRRDYSQAVHLAERTVEADPEAKVLVHAGYAHVYEAADDDWYPMAAYFRERTGIDPLTVSQTDLGERSAPRFEHPAYRAADAAGLLGDAPVVLLDASGAPLHVTSEAVDVEAVRPRTRAEAGRPSWMAALPGRVPVTLDLAPCSVNLCEVTVRRLGEDPAAIPLDRVVVRDGEVATVYVPTPGATATVRDGQTGAVLFDVPVVIDEVEAPAVERDR